MNARAITMRSGAVAFAAMHLWCASEAPAPATEPASDAGVDGAGESGSFDAQPDTGAPRWPACNDVLCRVSVPDADAVALDGVFVKSASDVWVVGSGGYAAHFDGAEWRRVATGTKATLYAVAGSDDGTVWAVSSGDSFFKLNQQTGGHAEIEDAGFAGVVRAIATVGAREAYAVGTEVDDFLDPSIDFIWRYSESAADGTWRWRPVSPPCPLGEFDRPACVELRAVWVESAERQWFAGANGAILRAEGADADGRLRLAETSSGSLLPFHALFGFGEDDIWAVGAHGTIRRFVGGDAWIEVTSPVSQSLYGVWGSRPDDVWAVGDEGVVLHWDGESWSVVPTPYGEENRPRLYAISGSGGEVWIAGEGTLLRSRIAEGER